MNALLRRRAALSACALMLSAGPLLAQSSDPDPRTTARGHVGAFYFTPRLAVKEFGVDSNVFNSVEQKKDFTFTLAPKVDVFVPFASRARISTTVGADAVYYQTYSSERSLDPSVDVRGDLFLGRVRPFAEGSYLRTRQRPNYEIDARSRRDEHMLGLGAAAQVTPKIAVEGGVQHATTAFAADAVFNAVSLQEMLNRDTRRTYVTVRHATTVLTTLALKTERSTERFEFSSVRDADSVRVMPGVEFKPSALISGSAYVGFRRFSPISTEVEPFSGLVTNTALTYVLKGATRFAVNADRDLTYSYERTEPYFVVGGVGVTVRRQIVGRIDALAGLQRQQYRYREFLVPGTVLTDPQRVDVTRTWTTSLGYRLGNGARVGIGTLYRERESNSSRFRNYDGFRIVSTVDYDF